MTQSSASVKTELTDEIVADYIKQHLDFFVRHDDILQMIRIQHNSGKAVSLIEYQLNRLRSHNQELQNQLNQLLSIARENDHLFEKLRRLTLALLEAESLEALIAALEDSLRHDFKINFVSFTLFSDKPLPTSRCCSVEEAQSKLGSLMTTQKIITGQFREEALAFLFTEFTKVKSAVIVPLNNNGMLGLLALGSQDPARYQRETGTVFLQHISDILCRLLPRLIEAVNARVIR